MTPSTLSTILNSAPLVIQGAGKLIDLIKEGGSAQNEPEEQSRLSLESLKSDVERLESHLQSVDESNIEQIKLIEQLARQNEMLAESVKQLSRQLGMLTMVAGISVIFSLSALVIVVL
ncbi:MAG: hypothetical protein GKR93_13885 [Gammaproteobacteria bacterium]|nr:hypothetical protein [Gammaproteobacteria bacterium]